MIRTEARVATEVFAAYEARAAAMEQMDAARKAVTEAVESLNLNSANIRRGPFLKSATRPIEVLQPIQALAEARADYLDTVITYNRCQFRLHRGLGNCPMLDNPWPLSWPAATAAAPPPTVPQSEFGQTREQRRSNGTENVPASR